MPTPDCKRILIINQDNIGDLVCTTPLIRRLRNAYPDACIDALVTSYNAAVLAGNPALDHVYAITKTKHVRGPGAKLRAAFGKLATLWQLRRNHYDLAFLATHSNNQRAIRTCRIAGIKQLAGMSKPGREGYLPQDLTQSEELAGKLNQAALFAQLADLVGIDSIIPPCEVYADATVVAESRARLGGLTLAEAPLIGLHISARKPSQRWTAENFILLARELNKQFGARLLLLWSPGDENNAQHPGDDRKARQIIDACTDLPLQAFPTQTLPHLIAGLSLVDCLICSDGGGMHIAAGLGKPIVCFFGQSGLSQWHPWGVPYVALQPPSLQVQDITVEHAVAAYRELCTRHRQDN
jgi:heptosyltransferase-3